MMPQYLTMPLYLTFACVVYRTSNHDAVFTLSHSHTLSNQITKPIVKIKYNNRIFKELNLFVGLGIAFVQVGAIIASENHFINCTGGVVILVIRNTYLIALSLKFILYNMILPVSTRTTCQRFKFPISVLLAEGKLSPTSFSEVLHQQESGPGSAHLLVFRPSWEVNISTLMIFTVCGFADVCIRQ